ncbi:MAG: hypothetical protein HPY62_12025, partial [Bacteroidales bacterium]|nr:hypothetical protein [Bacteroidales bacterium]
MNSCGQKRVSARYDFNSVNDRVWIGEDFWAVPLEDWHVKQGRIEYNGTGQQATCTVLPYIIGPGEKSFTISLDMGLLEMGANSGSAGIIIGSKAPEDDDIKAAIYFGSGINVGVNTDGYAFAGQSTKNLPSDFDFSHFRLVLTGEKNKEGFLLHLQVLDDEGKTAVELRTMPEAPLAGIIQLVNNPRSARSQNSGPKFWFDNISLEGPGLSYIPENRFGPVLWSMHTLSNNILKLTAQMPPISEKDNQLVEIEFKTVNKWVSAGS